MKKINNSWNPILSPDIHIPDCEGHLVYDNKLYVFGSEDCYVDKYCSKEYIATSTPDLKHWTVYNPIFNSNQVSWQGDSQHYTGGVDWENPSPYLRKMEERDKREKKSIDLNKFPVDDLYAPDVIEKNDKFYLFFCSSDTSEGVAIADRPEGPYRNAVRLHCDGIDPSVFIDDDGQAYLYWGQFYAHVAKLSDDMMHIDESSIKDNILTEEEHYFHEGSSVRKINGIYYYIFASISHGKPTSLDYATGESPYGPFTYRGTIINNEKCNPGNWNNHGSIGQFNGNWYIFYHRSSQGTEYNRRLCMEPIQVNSDGTIDEVQMTSQGVGTALPQNTWISFYRVCEISGNACLVPNSNGNEVLTNLSDGDSVLFRYFDFNTFCQNLQLVATGSGTISIMANHQLCGNVQIENGDVQKQRINLPTDKHVEVRLIISNATNLELSSIKFN